MARTLGYHEIGDLHFVSSVEGRAWFGQRPDEHFETHDEFAALVTSVHETYHVMQDVFLGACAVAAAADDYVAAAVRSGDKEAITAAVRQRKLARRLLFTTELSSRLIPAMPLPSELLDPVKDLTAVDLLECHAYVHTELYLAELRGARPNAFRDEIVADLGSLFQLPELERYDVPRRLLHAWLPFCRFDAANAQHPLNDVCGRAAEYTLLAFLLEQALDLPPMHNAEPHPLAMRCALEDADPVCRFIKLMATLASDMLAEAKAQRPISIDQRSLYADVLPRLVQRINIGNYLGMAINNGARHVPAVAELLGVDRSAILKRFGLPDSPDTFLLPGVTADRWLTRLRHVMPNERYTRIMTVRMRAMELRREQPTVFFDVTPLTFFAAIGLPGFFSARDGAKMTPPAIVIKDNVATAVGLPYEILDEVKERSLSIAAGEVSAEERNVRCPLATEGLRFIGCHARRDDCERLNGKATMPSTGCALRDCLEPQQKRRSLWPFSRPS